MSHRHTWLYVDVSCKPLPIWKRRCKCGVVQTYRAVREKRK